MRRGWSDRDRLVDVLYYLAQAVFTTLLAFRVLGLVGRPFSVPMIYRGDALAGGAQIKATLETGWYETNPMLGAPFGQSTHDFPVADNLQFASAKLFGLFTDQWGAAYNAAYLATFPLTALAATWFLRVVGAQRVTAFAFGLLYAFTPYHFMHGQPHLALSMLFVVPLFAALVFKVLDEQPIWRRRRGARWFNPWGHCTGTTLGTIAIVALTGSTSSYYSVFGLILMSLAVAVSALRRRFSLAGHGVVAMILLMAVMLANMAPDMLYQRAEGVSPAEFGRSPIDSEVYALKLASLVLPVPWHRIGALAEVRQEYDTTFPLRSESHALGVVAAIGLIYLLFVAAATLVRRRQEEDGPVGRSQRALSLMAIAAYLCGTVGGFGTLFALFVSPDIRAWNRITVYLALFSLASVALLVDCGLRRIRRRSGGLRRRAEQAATLGVCGVVMAVGLYDAVPGAHLNTQPGAVRAWNNDIDYVGRIEQRMPSGSAIFELPVMPYPEYGPVERLPDYDLLRPYLHSSQLRWSYGGVKGRPRADWQGALAGMSPAAMVTAIASAGFTGIHLDRFGYSRKAARHLENDLQQLLGAPIVSRSRRFRFYDLRQFAETMASAHGEDEWGRIGQHLLDVPVFYWQRGFKDPGRPDPEGRVILTSDSRRSTGIVDNPGDVVLMRFAFRIEPLGGPRSDAVTIDWPNGASETLRVGDQGLDVRRSLLVPRGQSQLSVTRPGARRSVTLSGFLMRDPVLVDLVLRGPAAGVAESSSPAGRSEHGAD